MLTVFAETAKTMRAPFPSDPEEFSSDSRISFSDTANAHILVDENGDDWEWLPHVSKWTRAVSVGENRKATCPFPHVSK